MYLATGEVEVPKRFGRWSSSSFSLYLWEARGATAGLAGKMLGTGADLEVAEGLGAQVAQQQYREKKVRFFLPGSRDHHLLPDRDSKQQERIVQDNRRGEGSPPLGDRSTSM